GRRCREGTRRGRRSHWPGRGAGRPGPREACSPVHVQRASEYREPRSVWERSPSPGSLYGREEMMKNTFKTYVLLAGIGGLLVLIGSFFGRSFAVLGLVIGLVFVGVSYWFSDKIAIRAARA